MGGRSNLAIFASKGGAEGQVKTLRKTGGGEGILRVSVVKRNKILFA